MIVQAMFLRANANGKDSNHVSLNSNKQAGCILSMKQLITMKTKKRINLFVVIRCQVKHLPSSL